LIQGAFTAEATARETMTLLTDRRRNQDMRTALDDVRRRLGAPGASSRAAAAVLGLTMGRATNN
jgi:lipid A disaccharide synthetase